MFKQIKGITGSSSVMGMCSVSLITAPMAPYHLLSSFFLFRACFTFEAELFYSPSVFYEPCCMQDFFSIPPPAIVRLLFSDT